MNYVIQIPSSGFQIRTSGYEIRTSGYEIPTIDFACLLNFKIPSHVVKNRSR